MAENIEGVIGDEETWSRIEKSVRWTEHKRGEVPPAQQPPSIIPPSIGFIRITGAADALGYYPARVSNRNPDSISFSQNWYEFDYDVDCLACTINTSEALSKERRYAAVANGYREGKPLLVAIPYFYQTYVRITGYASGYYSAVEVFRTINPEEWIQITPTVLFTNNISRIPSNTVTSTPALDPPVPPIIPNDQVVLIHADPWNVGKWVIAGACGGMTKVTLDFITPNCDQKTLVLAGRDLVGKIATYSPPPPGPPPPSPPPPPPAALSSTYDMPSAGTLHLPAPGFLAGAVVGSGYFPEIVTAPSSGTVKVFGELGHLRYVAPTNSGSTITAYTLTFRLTDGTNNSSNATVTFNVWPGGPATVSNSTKNVAINSLTYYNAANGALSGATVPFGYWAEVVTNVGAGTLWFSPDGSFRYKAPGSAGNTTFTFKLTDGTTSSSNGTVTINYS